MDRLGAGERGHGRSGRLLDHQDVKRVVVRTNIHSTGHEAPNVWRRGSWVGGGKYVVRAVICVCLDRFATYTDHTDRS